MTKLFSTERLFVRKFYPEDYEDLAEILTDVDVTYFEPYETFTKEACIKEAINFSKSEEFYAVVVDNKVIGKIYFSDKGCGNYEIGYTFNSNFQGKGYAYEAVKGMIEYSFKKMNVRRIFAEVNTRNNKSIKLIERLGMRKEAEHKEIYPRKENKNIYDDFYIYALVKSEICD